MHGYREVVKADVRRLMSLPNRKNVAQNSEELGFHLITFYTWRKVYRLQREGIGF
jgi:hypothetical protein